MAYRLPLLPQATTNEAKPVTIPNATVWTSASHVRMVSRSANNAYGEPPGYTTLGDTCYFGEWVVGTCWSVDAANATHRNAKRVTEQHQLAVKLSSVRDTKLDTQVVVKRATLS